MKGRTAATAAFLLLLAPLASAAADSAPQWILPAPDGSEVDFRARLADGPVVVSFWALWCKPCLKELPHLAALAAETAGRATILAVNADDPKGVAKVGPYLQGRGWDDLVVALDTGAEVRQQLQVDMLPFLVVYDREGREAYRHVGYRDGDEIELRRVVLDLIEGPAAVAAPAGPELGVVTATDRFEYSYEEETRREIVENWLDVSYRFGDFRTGVMLNSQSPGEEGARRHEIRQRYFVVDRPGWSLRAGHFYGLFGRGLVFNAVEDRNVRVDTGLDGVIGRIRSERTTATFLSGTPRVADVDARGADVQTRLGGGLTAGLSGLTWQDPGAIGADGAVDRPWVASLRLQQDFGPGDYYVEYGARNDIGLDLSGLDAGDRDDDAGWALYANLNLYRGPWSVSLEASDYQDFALVENADGKEPLNRPPSLARESTWTLLNRAPHTLSANDERGRNVDLAYNGDGWRTSLAGVHIERHDGRDVYREARLEASRERWRNLRLAGVMDYQESEGLRQSVGAEVSWFATAQTTWTLQAEHQHVRVGGEGAVDLGAYDQQWFKLECERAPSWAVAAILETNNKYVEQWGAGEKAGPFPALQITRVLSDGGTVNLWLGERQAGFLCAGGVCKREPAFSGVEVFGVLRY